MKKIAVLRSLLFLGLLPLLGWSSGSDSKKNMGKNDSDSTSSNAPAVAGQLLVSFKDGVNEKEVEKVFQKHSLKKLQKLGSMNLYLVELPENTETKEMQLKLKSEPTVKYSEPNSIMKTFKK